MERITRAREIVQEQSTTLHAADLVLSPAPCMAPQVLLNTETRNESWTQLGVPLKKHLKPNCERIINLITKGEGKEE